VNLCVVTVTTSCFRFMTCDGARRTAATGAITTIITTLLFLAPSTGRSTLLATLLIDLYLLLLKMGKLSAQRCVRTEPSKRALYMHMRHFCTRTSGTNCPDNCLEIGCYGVLGVAIVLRNACRCKSKYRFYKRSVGSTSALTKVHRDIS